MRNGVMGRWIRRAAAVFLAAVFVFSIAYIVLSRGEYEAADHIYEAAAHRFTTLSGTGQGNGKDSQDPQSLGASQGEAGRLPEDGGTLLETAPISVDFQGLLEVNEDVVGWIYCPGTNINYPVLHGRDNDVYLRRSYDGSYNNAGSIFVEASNQKGFADANTIIYGHHMESGAEMFADLEEWESQEFYEEHPVMWLLTPEQDYKIVLFSGYTASAYSDAYQVFQESGGEMEEYIAQRRALSEFQAQVKLDPEGKYVMLSTCSYEFEDARSVLHGMLVPLDSAGGTPK